MAVKDLSVSIPLFEKLLNTLCYKTETVDSENVNTAFFQKGESKIELLERNNLASAIRCRCPPDNAVPRSPTLVS